MALEDDNPITGAVFPLMVTWVSVGLDKVIFIPPPRNADVLPLMVTWVSVGSELSKFIPPALSLPGHR